MTTASDVAGISRRGLLGGAVAGAAALALSACSSSPSSEPTTTSAPDAATGFDELDAKIEEGMKAYAIPGVAVGILAGGQEYIKGYGVTNVDHPVPVDGDTVFRIGSTTKTFTGTTLMRLVDQGKVDLDAPVRRYLPDFAVADPSASVTVTVRQLLNHTAGWLGDDLQDFGRGDDALSRYVASMTRLPQLTPPGTVFAYNNAGLVVAGRIIEVVTGSTYEAAVQSLLLDPLELTHTRYFSDQIIGFNIAASHNVVDGKPVVDNGFWGFPRSCNPTGSLISSVRDQLRYARFHLGDGAAPNGARLLSQQALVAMRSNPGAGGTLQVELTGMGVTWMLRPSAENETIVQHGGTWQGQRSGFFMVPSRNFAMTLLTNSEGGAQLTTDLFADDWAMRRFAGISNMPAEPQTLSAADLAPYEGRYVTEQITESGSLEKVVIEFEGRDGRLHGTMSDLADPSTHPDEDADTSAHLGFAFYRPDYGLDLGPDGQTLGTRSNFVRDPNGNVAWLRTHGRLYRRQ
ncbi:penicillin-binding protein [Mycobacterium sp. 852002-51152_SCH6134967]|uniref:serine hydrolase domain-containing protein n=1 Tax=Mycobacterium sp. 852002-51152_SCH6134967 TaxID=1834096 RepID=UPI0007FC5F0F|nr:serine hydrolase domain-containing protein [Mycobacterium sp. 852002-51152_SCH6134967]OBF90719.1 penicillin-binding protein [Mycobacterium sp. 852002-51152_SCH6134967]